MHKKQQCIHSQPAQGALSSHHRNLGALEQQCIRPNPAQGNQATIHVGAPSRSASARNLTMKSEREAPIRGAAAHNKESSGRWSGRRRRPREGTAGEPPRMSYKMATSRKNILRARTLFAHCAKRASKVQRGPQRILAGNKISARCFCKRPMAASVQRGRPKGHRQFEEDRNHIPETKCAANSSVSDMSKWKQA